MEGVWVCIVEGDGEAGSTQPGSKIEGAVRLLLPRIVHHKWQRYIQFKSYNASGRGNLTRKGGIEHFLKRAFREPNLKAILIALDAETDCAAKISQELADRARRLAPRIPVTVVVANKCYEAWLISGLCLSDTPEGIAPGKAKKILDEEVRKRGIGTAYAETLHQMRLTDQMSLGMAYRRCRSFRRFVKAVGQLLDAIDNQATIVTP